jgi:hypothetical protein
MLDLLSFSGRFLSKFSPPPKPMIIPRSPSIVHKACDTADQQLCADHAFGKLQRKGVFEPHLSKFHIFTNSSHKFSLIVLSHLCLEVSYIFSSFHIFKPKL